MSTNYSFQIHVMDYYNTATEKEDVQAFKILKPAKKQSEHLYRKSCIYKKEAELDNTNFYKEFIKDSSFPKSLSIDSSTSLVLKKKKEINILAKHSFRSFGNKLSDPSKSEIVDTSSSYNNEPLIKITVIPRSVYTQTSSPQCDYSTKFAQHTSSHENSFKTKNIYLVVAGRKKEKIYELKTTGSGKFKDDNKPYNNKEIAINRLCVRRFVDYLNMEKKNIKGKIKKVDENITKYKKNEHSQHYCTCVGSKQTNNEDGLRRPVQVDSIRRPVKVDSQRQPIKIDGLQRPVDGGVPSKNRVRISGHLGVTEDDAYVLKCEANVDGKPVTNICPDEWKNRAPEATQPFAKEKQPVSEDKLKDYRSSCSCDANKFADSQATQVNFTSNVVHKNQQVQYNGCSEKNIKECFDINDQIESPSDEDNNLEKCQSLVVVISVYPKQDVPGKQKSEQTKTHIARKKNSLNQDCYKIPMIQICEPAKTHTSRKKTTSSPYYYKIHQNQNTLCEQRLENNTKQRSSSRSPSPPVKLPAKLKPYTAKFEVNKNTNRIRPLSPKAQMSVNANRQRNFSPQMKKREIISGNATIAETKISGWPGKHINTKENKSTNTENVLAKRMLIEDFLRTSLAHLDKKENAETNTSKKFNDISKVSIDIDGEHEYYDVQYRRGTQSADLKVKKSIKNQKKCLNCEYNSPSMENFLLLPDGGRTRNKSFSQTIFDAQTDNMPKLDKTGAILKVQDSLEISHRREGNLVDSIESPMANNSFNNESSNFDFFAPIKHYRGDNCSITDPMERDKEIRELLGVELPRSRNLPISSQEHIIGDHATTTNNNVDSGLISLNYPIEIHPKENKINNKISNKKSYTKNKKVNVDLVRNGTYNKSVFTQYEFYDQIGRNIFTRSIQSYLQNNERRPIVLTRKQYKKMKKVLQVKVSKKRCNKRYSGVSVGEVRQRFKKSVPLHYDKEVQTDIIQLKCKQIQQTELSFDASSHNTEPMATLSDDLIEINNYTDSNELNNESKSLGSNKQSEHSEQAEIKSVYQSVQNLKRNCELNIINDNCMEKRIVKKLHSPPRRTVSSVEVHYASIAYKHVTFSNSTIGDHVVQPSFMENTLDKDSTSVQTIYKRPMCDRKCLTPNLERSAYPTPNLGRSAFSFFSEDTNFSPLKHGSNNLTDLKGRKPFLKRLMSCLVMRSTRAAEVKIGAKKGDGLCKVANKRSVDSYYINTSLAAVELSSSLYDTSASFFSNHTIYPVLNSKIIKRGFLSSVRGLLGNRK